MPRVIPYAHAVGFGIDNLHTHTLTDTGKTSLLPGNNTINDGLGTLWRKKLLLTLVRTTASVTHTQWTAMTRGLHLKVGQASTPLFRMPHLMGHGHWTPPVPCSDIASLLASNVDRTACIFGCALDLICSGGSPSGNCDSPRKMGTSPVFLFA